MGRWVIRLLVSLIGLGLAVYGAKTISDATTTLDAKEQAHVYTGAIVAFLGVVTFAWAIARKKRPK